MTSSVNYWNDDAMESTISADVTTESRRENQSALLLVDNLPYTTVVNGYISPVIIAITIVTNTFVCVVLLQRNMRSPTNLLLLAMAVADSLTGAIPAPSFLYFYTFGGYRYRYVPYGWCHANTALNVVFPTICHTVSIWLTVALSVQRYVYVCHPVEAKRLCTANSAAKTIAVICIVAVLTQSTPLFEWNYVPVEVEVSAVPVDQVPDADAIAASAASVTDVGVFDVSGTVYPQIVATSAATTSIKMYGCYREMTGFISAYKEIYFSTYWWFRVVFIHLIPCTSLVVLNARLFLAMRAAQIRRDLLLRQNRRSESRRLAESNLATLMLLSVVGVFLLVEFPLAVLLITLIIENTFDMELMAAEDRRLASLFINLCILLSYPVNFFIYCAMSRQFRDTFQRLFCRGGGGEGHRPVQDGRSVAGNGGQHGNGSLAVEMTAIDGATTAWQRS